MRRLNTKYNNNQRDMLNKAIRERGKLFLRRLIGFGYS